jgi:hypothetical protein
MTLADQIAFLISFLLTLLVFSYLLGDNPLFRIVVYLFIGVSAGYAGAVAVWQVIIPNVVAPLAQGLSGDVLLTLALVLPPLLAGLLLLAKLSPRVAWLGNPTMAFLVGVGAAAAIGGALLGTLFPQVSSTVELFDLQGARAGGVSAGERVFEGSIVLVGTVATLMYFHFGVQARPDHPPVRSRWIEGAAWVGQIFIAITFGVLFAGVYTAALTALIERLDFLLNLRLFIASFL